MLGRRIQNRGITAALNTWREATLLYIAEKDCAVELQEILLGDAIRKAAVDAIALARAEPRPEISRDINVNVNWSELLQVRCGLPR